MKSMQIRRKNESGQSLVEYGLILGLIVVGVIGVLVIMGPKIKNVFTNANTEMTGDAFAAPTT